MKACTTHRQMHQFPGGKKFAFTIIDDTDFSTVENVRPVYEFLLDLGMRTTKTIWPLSSAEFAEEYGSSMSDPAYRSFVLDIQREGTELALHNVQHGTATRNRTHRGLQAFAGISGSMPRVHCNHETNYENLYWGSERFSTRFRRALYSATTAMENSDRKSAGHLDDSEFFWGDLCREHVSYVRNLVFREINLDRVNPSMPYHDPAKPWVNAWFSACDGEDVDRFCRLISEENQDRLEAEGGVCIVYTHLAYGFFDQGRMHPQFEQLMRRLATKDGWFVPVSDLLDQLRAERGATEISPAELRSMEYRWFRDRFEGKLLNAVTVRARAWNRFKKVGEAQRKRKRNFARPTELPAPYSPAMLREEMAAKQASFEPGGD